MRYHHQSIGSAVTHPTNKIRVRDKTQAKQENMLEKNAPSFGERVSINDIGV